MLHTWTSFSTKKLKEDELIVLLLNCKMNHLYFKHFRYSVFIHWQAIFFDTSLDQTALVKCTFVCLNGLVRCRMQRFERRKGAGKRWGLLQDGPFPLH